MAKLTAEQIESIDNLLCMKGVNFIDIRYEMTDHIASALEEKEGDFRTNLKEYFITHNLQLLAQNKKAKRTAIIRAVKHYFKTMATPLVFLLAAFLGIAIYRASYFVEDGDITFFGSCILLVMIVPLLWVGRKNRALSVMRPMVLIHSALYSLHQLVVIASCSIDDRALRTMLFRINISVTPALLLVLIISLYQCRKQYAGKYI